jgi:RHH-type proline utilization regulon transcriptional repressor/proline dehydrogenase/delta 1-pyrroline-5-carboxylate dehydrogenase
VIEDAGGVDGFEFQRLYGMGEALYDALLAELPDAACRVYAPVGGHRDLLAYLVRRLLENGANSSFVSVAADPSVPIAEILRRPQSRIAGAARRATQNSAAARSLSAGAARLGGHRVRRARKPRRAARRGSRRRNGAAEAAPLVDGVAAARHRAPVRSPIDGRVVGVVREATTRSSGAAMAAAAAGFPAWAATPVEQRAAALRAADRLEKRGRLLALLQNEGGKTLDDALAELREAVDYCRYYAAQARISLAPQAMPGPTGESNVLRYRGRGVFVCISPWNFPLAIFLGQVTAALAAGNTSSPSPPSRRRSSPRAPWRCCIRPACRRHALHSFPATASRREPRRRPRVAGVAFTGSTEVGRAINRALAAKTARSCR